MFLTEIESLDSAFPGWSAVVLHYAALNLMDAYLHSNGRDHGSTHGERGRMLAELLEARRLATVTRDAYLRLADRSRAARYEAVVPTAVDLAVLMADFRRIEAEILPRLRLTPFARLPFEPEP
jgi:hypothetical protein